MQTFGHPVRTACTQFLVVAAIALAIGGLWGSLSFGAAIAAGPELVLLGVGWTALAFGFQTIALPPTPASHAAIIVSAEGAFGAMAAPLFLNERITMAALFGAALMLSAIVYLAFADVQRETVTSPVERARRLIRNCSIFGSTAERENGSAKVCHGSGRIVLLRAE